MPMPAVMRALYPVDARDHLGGMVEKPDFMDMTQEEA